jgi:hypothetical protein
MRGCDIILEYFIAGMVFVSIVSPLLEEIATVIAQGLQVIAGFFKIIVTQQSVKITKLKLPVTVPPGPPPVPPPEPVP